MTSPFKIDDPVRIGVIGCGYWGPNIIRNLVNNPDCSIQFICDRNPERLDYARSTFRGVPTTPNQEDILSHGRINAVVIATELQSHYQLVKETLLRGKNVFVEKPLAATVSECRELIELSEKKKLTLLVGHTYLYNPAVNLIKDYIKNGELGEIYYIFSQRLNLGRVRKDANVMWYLAPHDISMILYWLEDQPSRVKAYGYDYLQKNLEDVVYLNLEFPSGPSAQIQSSWLNPNKIRETSIVGSKKTIIYDDMSSDSKVQIYDKGISRTNIHDHLGRYDNFGKFQLLQRAGDIFVPKIEFVEPLSLECQDFIDSIKQKRKPISDAITGLNVVQILESAQESLKKNI